jgi:predicted SAM-dependent methyltransferase
MLPTISGPTSETGTHLHLGCGKSHLPGFINIDARPSDSVDISCDIRRLPYQNNSINTIYMCHSLEHLPLPEIQYFLKYIHGLLDDEGKFFISVPDFNILASMYLSKIVNLSTIVRAIHGGQEYDGNTHYLSFDAEFLTGLLKAAGFKHISFYNPSEFLPFGFTDTSTYEIAGKKISLNIVATK